MQHLDRCEATGKVCYTFDEASTKARSARRRSCAEDKGRPASAYHCTSCGWSHYGHRTETKGKRKRRLGR